MDALMSSPCCRASRVARRRCLRAAFAGAAAHQCDFHIHQLFGVIAIGRAHEAPGVLENSVGVLEVFGFAKRKTVVKGQRCDAAGAIGVIGKGCLGKLFRRPDMGGGIGVTTLRRRGPVRFVGGVEVFLLGTGRPQRRGGETGDREASKALLRGTRHGLSAVRRLGPIAP